MCVFFPVYLVIKRGYLFPDSPSPHDTHDQLTAYAVHSYLLQLTGDFRARTYP